MKRSSTIWRPLFAAAVVATGVAVVWAFAFTWVGSLASELTERSRVTERLQVALDGTPVIAVMSQSGYGQVYLSRRTLDGTTWPADYEDWLSPAFLAAHPVAPALFPLEPQWTSWGQRIGGATDGKKPPTAWYFMRTVDPPGKIYWVGYDTVSKLRIGYLGTKGFRVTAPPPDECFSQPQGNLGRLNELIVSGQSFEFGYLVGYHSLSRDARPVPWLAFQIDGDNVWQVDLRDRSARVLTAAPGAVSIGLLSTAEALVDSALGSRSPSNAGESADPPAPTHPDDRPRFASVLATRSADRIVLTNPMTQTEREFVLPKEVPAIGTSEWIYVYWSKPDELLINYRDGYWSDGPIEQFLWCTPDGSVSRRKRVELQGYLPRSERETAWRMAPMLPVPIAWLGVAGIVQPCTKLQWREADTYRDALQKTFAVNWPPMAVVMAVALLCLWPAMRWHGRYARSHRWWWAALVGLFGPAGLIAYWLEHRRASLAECGECHETVPRDRDHCAACETPFAAPAPVGTEIFA